MGQVVQVTRFGPPEVLVATTVPDLVPGPGEVIIAVSVAVMLLWTRHPVRRAAAWFPSPLQVPGNGVAASQRDGKSRESRLAPGRGR